MGAAGLSSGLDVLRAQVRSCPGISVVRAAGCRFVPRHPPAVELETLKLGGLDSEVLMALRDERILTMLSVLRSAAARSPVV